MTQCERILKYLDEHGSITRAEAMSECGIANFTARVSDLRRDGVALDVETVTQKRTATARLCGLRDIEGKHEPLRN